MKPVVYNCNITDMSDDDLTRMFRKVVSDMVVVFPKQSLSIDDQLRIVSVAGNYQKTESNRLRGLSAANGILRVGKTGLFGHKKDLDWHANQPSNPKRDPLIWLYGVSGTKGSRTSWINMIDAYNDLDQDIKEMISDITMYCGFERGKYSDWDFFHDHINRDVPRKLVHKNVENKTGLFFPFYQIMEFKDKSQAEFRYIMKILQDHVLQDKYMYHHDWEDGDLVISEQWLSIHKRWAFDKIDQRVLHRIAFDYSNIYDKNNTLES